MSTPTPPIMVVAKDYFTFHQWLNTKENQDQYVFVHGVNILEAYPEADGILLQDWANRNDAGEIHQWIENRKRQRLDKKIFDSMNVVPNATMTLEHGGHTYQLFNFEGDYTAYIDGVRQEYKRNKNA